MVRTSQNKNMSKSSGRSKEQQKNSGTGNESDASVGSVINEMKMQKTMAPTMRLGKNKFGRGVWAKVLFGEIFSEDNGDYEIQWDKKPKEVQLTWTVNCNLDGHEGIACDDNGSGYAGWDDTQKLYLGLDSEISKNERCMRIIEIENQVKDETKAARKERKTARNSGSETSASELEYTELAAKIVENKQVKVKSDKSKPTCSFNVSKPKRIPIACGKDVIINGLCAKHARKRAKNADPNAMTTKDILDYAEMFEMPVESDVIKQVLAKASDNESETNAKTDEDDTKTDEDDDDDDDDTKTKTDDDDDTKTKTDDDDDTKTKTDDDDDDGNNSKSSRSDLTTQLSCDYEFTKGKSKGDVCGKPPKTGSDKCSKHSGSKSSKKKADGEKNEISDQGGDKFSDMAQSIQIKNMLEAVTSKLIDIVGSILSEKRVKKILKHIQLQENQEALTIVMQNTMPKAKIIRSNVKTGGKRRKKDPAAPKRNLTSYILFCQDKRTEVKDSNPNLKGVDITKKLGLLWNESSEKVKAKYTKRAVKDKTRYTEEMKDYTPSAEWLVESDSDTGSKTKTNKPRTGPKKVSSAYIFFCKDMRDNIKDNNPDMDSKDVTRELGRLWKDEYKDNAKKSAIWFTKADEDKERFAYDKSKWVDNEANEDSDKYAPEATKTVENESEPDTKSEPETKKSKSKYKKV